MKNNKVNMTVTFRISLEEVPDFINSVLKYEIAKITRKKYWEGMIPERERIRRFKIILGYLSREKEITSGELWTKLRKEYGRTYKTFARDIIKLAMESRIITRKSNTGKLGRTTFIKKVKQ